MMTKKGGFDFAFNFQAVMTNNHVIFVGLLLSQPNDQKSLPDVYRQMKKNIRYVSGNAIQIRIKE